MKKSTTKHLDSEITALKEMLEEQQLEINVLRRALADLRMLVYKSTGDQIRNQKTA